MQKCWTYIRKINLDTKIWGFYSSRDYQLVYNISWVYDVDLWSWPFLHFVTASCLYEDWLISNEKSIEGVFV